MDMAWEGQNRACQTFRLCQTLVLELENRFEVYKLGSEYEM